MAKYDDLHRKLDALVRGEVLHFDVRDKSEARNLQNAIGKYGRRTGRAYRMCYFQSRLAVWLRPSREIPPYLLLD